MTSWREIATPLVLLLLAVSWTVRFLLNNDVASGIIGLAFLLGSLSYLVHSIVEESLRNTHWRMLEAGLTVSTIVLVVAGYFLTGSTILAILSVLLILLILLGFTLSYLIPRMRGEA